MIKNELNFALFAIKKNFQNSAELRSSFLMNIIGMTINNSAFIFLWAFFVKSVGVIGGWTVADIFGLQGYVAFCFGMVFSICSGLRDLAEYTSSGAFDRYMLAPKNLLLRVATSNLGVSALGDVVFGLVALTIYGVMLQVSIFQILLMIVMALLSTVVFFAVVVAFSSASFYFVDSAPVVRSLLELFITPALFHGGAFQGAMRFVFTFVVPSLAIGTLPVEIVRDVSLDKLLLVGVLAVVWLFVGIKLFYWSIRKYESSNFMTFGS